MLLDEVVAGGGGVRCTAAVMINVCYNCGIYRADKLIDPSGPFAICPEYGFKHPFRQLPLLVVSGASGAGKSSCRLLFYR